MSKRIKRTRNELLIKVPRPVEDSKAPGHVLWGWLKACLTKEFGEIIHANVSIGTGKSRPDQATRSQVLNATRSLPASIFFLFHLIHTPFAEDWLVIGDTQFQVRSFVEALLHTISVCFNLAS